MRCAHSSRIRLIPAHAGNTTQLLVPASRSWAHPRSRGEHVLAIRFVSNNRGSSPLARGTREAVANQIEANELIPARAGNNPLAMLFSSPRDGSSPLAQGTLRPRSGGMCNGGLIPARAGNTTQP